MKMGIEKNWRLAVGFIALLCLMLPMSSCGDDSKDEPEPPLPGVGEYECVYLKPEVNHISMGIEGGEVTVKVLWTDEDVPPATLTGHDRERYYSIAFQCLEIRTQDNGNILSVSHTHESEDGYQTVSALEGFKYKQEIRDDGYIYITVCIPPNQYPVYFRYVFDFGYTQYFPDGKPPHIIVSCRIWLSQLSNYWNN